MRRITALALSILAFAAPPAAAQVIAYGHIEDEVVQSGAGSERFVEARAAPVPQGLATFGPFRVLDDSRAALVDVTDARSPAALAALLRAYPGVAVLELRDCPGTEDDLANLALGRMIRAKGLATHVPANGSVRSGAVELFLAGSTRSIADGAEFAVHAWEDEDGRQAGDYAANAPENRKYIAYYLEMGMTSAQAGAFYAMTNSAPFEAARWLDAAEMRGWMQGPLQDSPTTRLARLDLAVALP